MMKALIALILATALVTLVGACREGAPGAADASGTAETAAVDPCAGLSGFDALRCSDPDVRQMDDELAAMVSRVAANSSHSDRADVRAAQAAWERDRDTCLELAVPKRRSCIDAKYTNRFVEVRQLLELIPD